MLPPALPVPNWAWEDVGMDFIENLLQSCGKDVFMVIVDQLSKYSLFIVAEHPYTTIDVAQAFLDNIYKLYRFPKSIVSEWDKVFLTTF